MKKLSFVILSSIALFSACQPKVDIEKEKAAIQDVIRQEVNAFITKDMDKFVSFYVQDESNTRLQQSCSVEYPIITGWINVKSFLEPMMNRFGTEVTNVKNSKEDFIIKVKGDCAWVVNKDVWSYEDNGKPVQGTAIQTTFMEKIDGNWKISLLSHFSRGQSSDESKDTTAIKR